jgi:hypothetical protein
MPSLHSPGEVLRWLARAVDQTDDPEYLIDPAAGGLGRQAVQTGEKLEVLPRAEIWVDRQLLGHVTDG